MTPEQEFHAHLESCEQCEKNPFDLCPTGHVLLMATGNGPMETPGEPPSEQDLRTRINRQVSQLRAKDQHKHDCNCGECLTDWHDDAHWPTLLWELPRNTHLFRNATPAEGIPDEYKVCGCFSEGQIRVCQDGDNPGMAVVKAWIAFTLGKKLFGTNPDFPFAAPGSNTVH